jgi:hypothetical protein
MLRIGSGTLVILETAFDEAWITLKTNGIRDVRALTKRLRQP